METFLVETFHCYAWKDNMSSSINHVLFFQDVDCEDYWEKLAQESDPSRQQNELLNYSAVLPQLKSKILAFKAQVLGNNFSIEHELCLPQDNLTLFFFVRLADRWRCERSVADSPPAEGLAQPDSDLWPWEVTSYWSWTWTTPCPLWPRPWGHRQLKFHHGQCSGMGPYSGMN